MAELERYEGAATIEKVAALCRRRGFVYPSSDIYGGLGSAYDYGHYGVLLKQNVKAAWQRALVQERDDIVAARLGDHPATPRSGSPRATSAASPIRSSTAAPASSASAPTTSTSRACGRKPVEASRRDAGLRPDRGARSST